MQFQQSGEVRFYSFEFLNQAGLRHAIFTRNGGVSPAPWQSLNVGGTVGDQPDRVVRNRRIAFGALNRDPASIYDVWQVHGERVVRAQSPRPSQAPYHQADAILTNQPEVTLFMRFADCVPILLYDPVQRAAGLVHAGWQGTVQLIVARAVEAMRTWFGSRPGEIMAGIGPSIGPDHYEIGPDVAARVRGSFGERARSLLVRHGPATHLDLWEANRITLRQADVTQIEVAGHCTACHLEEWYSHRAEGGRTGRFGALVGLG